MIDLFILLTPLVVLPISLLFGFVGCSVEHPNPFRNCEQRSSSGVILRVNNRGGFDRISEIFCTITLDDLPGTPSFNLQIYPDNLITDIDPLLGLSFFRITHLYPNCFSVHIGEAASGTWTVECDVIVLMPVSGTSGSYVLEHRTNRQTHIQSSTDNVIDTFEWTLSSDGLHLINTTPST
jgi:hypothetical protein